MLNYRRSNYAWLLQYMQCQYKALRHALGPELFTDFAREYLQDTLSRGSRLALPGGDFSDWLLHNRHDIGLVGRQDSGQDSKSERWMDFVIELADFEWTLCTLFDAPGAERLGYATEEHMDHPHLRLQPALRLCRHNFPVGEYYRQVTGGEEPEFPDVADSCVALVRTGYRIGIFTLLPAQYHLLTQLQETDISIEDAWENTVQTFDLVAVSAKHVVRVWLRTWLQAGFFSKPGKGVIVDIRHR